MSSARSVCCRILAVVLAGGCLLAADFNRPDPAGFTLGKTTEQEIRQRFGQPDGQATGQGGDQTGLALQYTPGETAGAAAAARAGGRAVLVLQCTHVETAGDVVAARAMVYTFNGGRLVGFDYSSSFA